MSKPVSALAAKSDLFDPIVLGPYTLANRIVMAPLTRSRADDEGVPGELQATYYAQRASAGLIISEATNISPQGKGYIRTPGIWSKEQVEGWKLTTKAVHDRGGRIYLQLWHVGRVSHPDLQPGGSLPVAPSAVRAENQQAYTYEGFKPLVTPRALETAEISGIVADYAHAAKRAKEAGFDGVEIHAANGYLLQQFLSDKTNKRTDQYGGSIENRTRIVVEVVDAVVKVWGGDRVGIRLAPLTKFADIGDSNPEPVYLSLVEQLNPFKLSYIHVVEGDTGGDRNPSGAFDLQKLRRAFNGLYMANNNYTLELAVEARAENLADLICFGRPFIANPDLVERLREGAPLATPDPSTFYAGEAKGYTDYPAL
ncbi:N-ethylmaleimide reductase [Hyphomicrobium sp. xq]|uniref:N-ethylmaleimide reductase n=1 Tax=Hyphomicrobium album TaxID=2665159 RepID=A0A6I3KNA9_9HYPH|nr:alkene reductase [Hyphomicrobium album]MTD95798.1 N-ethylmaleimide reductase [Hyphomicrobium album]